MVIDLPFGRPEGGHGINILHRYSLGGVPGSDQNLKEYNHSNHKAKTTIKKNNGAFFTYLSPFLVFLSFSTRGSGFPPTPYKKRPFQSHKQKDMTSVFIRVHQWAFLVGFSISFLYVSIKKKPQVRLNQICCLC